MKTIQNLVTRWFGSVVFAGLCGSAIAQPIILTQPQSQMVTTGNSVTLSVAAAPTTTSSTLPTVTSGTLQLWLKADAGVITNSYGQVSQWQDQSGNDNNASQSETTNQPLLVNPPLLWGKPAIRFNGIQDNVNGDYLSGSGDVGLANAMTAFTVYNTFRTDNAVDVLWLVGAPGTYGACRDNCFLNGQMDLSTWAYENIVPWVSPTNTCRLWTDRVNSNLTTVEIFDTARDGSTNFSVPMSEAVPPSGGYYVGGLTPAWDVEGDNYEGDLAELIFYKGYLSDADRLAVQGYLQQKYYLTNLTAGISFQWQFDSANIAGATNDTLTLADVQTNEAGNYSVIVTAGAISLTSSNALLTVGDSPSISQEPQSQQVIQGTNVTLTVVATGSAPLDYQWAFNGVPINQATNSALQLMNVQGVDAGSYIVTVSNFYGSTVSSAGILIVDLAPTILTEPQNQSVVAGDNVTFSVNVVGSYSTLPPVTSGTLQLWLKADSGVITNSSGQVSQWQDQSGNNNNARQSATNNQPVLVNPPLIGGMPAIRFNGIQDNINGDYLSGTGNVGLTNAMTAFTVYNTFRTDNAVDVLWLIGAPGQAEACRDNCFLNGQVDFSTWSYENLVSWVSPTNTYRLWTDRVNSNLTSVEIFDAAVNSSTNFSVTMNPATTPNAGYYVGGLLTYRNIDNYEGDLAELIFYRGYLSDADRLAVQSYLQQKYYMTNVTTGFSFQWQFDGTNIAGATNATLTLANLQTTNTGVYSVIVSNLAGSVTSSNALLSIDLAMDLAPQSQTADVGSSVTFTAAASGTAPVFYQWTFNGTNIAGATNTSLTLVNVQTNQAGNYRVSVSNSYGTVTSSNAALTVLISTIQAISVSTSEGTSVTVPVQLMALGTENALGFSIDFDPDLLTYTGATLSGEGTNAALVPNLDQIGSGHLGIGLELPTDEMFSAGTNPILNVTFEVGGVTNFTTTPITLGGAPTREQLSDAQANLLQAVYVPGVIGISKAQLEGDASPRPNGDGVVGVTDWVQEGRFVAGLDTIAGTNEFQRADCAPRDTLGDGYITVADWVQIGRYAVGLDPATAVGGLTGPPEQNMARPVKLSPGVPFSFVPVSQSGSNTTVAVQLGASGTESAFSFTVTYDPATVLFRGGALGTGAAGATLFVNTNQATNGAIGIVAGYVPPTVFAAGARQVVQLTFTSFAYSNNAALGFSDSPVLRQVVDSGANVLTATYQSTTLPITGRAWPPITIQQTQNALTLWWSTSAAGFIIESAPTLSGPWTPVTANLVTNANGVTLTAPISSDGGFFRLQQP